MLELIIVVLLICALFGGVTWGPWVEPTGRNPIYLILMVIVVLWLLSYIGVLGGHGRYHW